MQKLICLICAGLLAAVCVSCAGPDLEPIESETPHAEHLGQESAGVITAEPAPDPTPAPEFDLLFSEEDVFLVAQVMEHECANVPSVTHQAAVAWTICNRVDAKMGGTTIAEVCTYPNQYAYYPSTVPRAEMLWLARDVLTRWSMERAGIEDVGRVLAADFMWFHGTGTINIFRNAYRGGDIWDWSLESPYE